MFPQKFPRGAVAPLAVWGKMPSKYLLGASGPPSFKSGYQTFSICALSLPQVVMTRFSDCLAIHTTGYDACLLHKWRIGGVYDSDIPLWLVSKFFLSQSTFWDTKTAYLLCLRRFSHCLKNFFKNSLRMCVVHRFLTLKIWCEGSCFLPP